MEEVKPRFTGAMIVSVLIAFVLTILPIPEQWIVFRPEWLALTFIHWGLMSPNKSSIMLAWFVGLLIDVVFGSIIGQHGLGFTIVVFMALRIRTRILLDSFVHQLFAVFLILGTYLLINLWILGITGNSPDGWTYWLTVISSLVIWPFYHYFLTIFHARKKPFE